MYVHNGTMRLATAFLLLAVVPQFAQTSDEKDAIATVQKTFDGMAAHDAATIRSTMLPDARLYSVRADREPSTITGESFINQITAAKGELIERFTATPSVSIRARMAQVWGEYEFLRDGKFSHCGVDTLTLFKTNDGWKIATIAYTVETTGCKGH
jgi:Putative lumazine-binding